MVKRDLIRHIYCVCIGEANCQCFVLSNGFTATEVTIGELARGKGLLVMRSWVLYLRSIMVKRDLMRHIYCVCIEANYLWLILTNGFTAADVTDSKGASLWSEYLCDLGSSIYDISCSVVAFIQSI